MHRKDISVSLSLQEFMKKHLLNSRLLLFFSPQPPSLLSLSLFLVSSPLLLRSSNIPLILVLPRTSVRRENWPHEKWKGLFKRNGGVMKTHYCIPWCTAWPQSCLVRLGGSGWCFLHVFVSLPLLFLIVSPLFSFSLTVTISFFCFLFISSFSLCHFIPPLLRLLCMMLLQGDVAPAPVNTSITIYKDPQSLGVLSLSSL